MTTPSSSKEDLARILESARRLGVEMDEADALQWLAAMGAGDGGGDIVVDTRTGVFGHRISMLDFSPGRPGALPLHRPPGRVRRRARRGRDGPGALRLGRPVEDPVLPGRLRLLRAGQHQRRRRAPEACAILARADPRQGAGDGQGRHLPADRGEVRLLPRGRGPRRRAGQGGIAHRLARRTRSAPGRSTRFRPDGTPVDDRLGGGRARPRLVQARLGGRRPGARAAGQRQQHARRDLGSARRHRSRRSTATSTRTSRRSTWRPSRSRSSPSWPSTSRPTPWTSTSPSSRRRSTST